MSHLSSLWLGCLLAVALVFAASTSAEAAPRASLRAEFGAGPMTFAIDAFRVPNGSGGLLGPTEFYSYNVPSPASANPAVDFLQPDTANYLVLDDGTDLYLVVVFDDVADATGGRFAGTIESTGLASTSADFVVVDDPGDMRMWDSSTGTGTFDFATSPCCTDGFVLGPLPRDADWSVSLRYTMTTNLDSFAVLDWGECAGDPQFEVIPVPTSVANTLTIYADVSAIVDCAVADGDADGLGSCCGDCDDADATVYPGADELCDGVINDCERPDAADGADEPTLADSCDGADTDLCEGGAIECVEGALSCSDDAESLLDVCDGTDNDCDPSTDDGAGDEMLGASCDGDDADSCASGAYLCNEGALACDETGAAIAETCNGEDDDCDGSVDEGLPECVDAGPVAVDAFMALDAGVDGGGDDDGGCGCRTAGTRTRSAPAWLLVLALVPLWRRRR